MKLDLRDRITRQLLIDPANWRVGMLTLMLRASLVLGALVYVPSVYLALQSGLVGVVVIDTLSLGLVIGMLFFDRVPFRVRAAVFCAICYALGVALLLWVGSISQIYLFGFSIITALLLGLRAGLATALLSSATLLVVGYVGQSTSDMVTAAWGAGFPGWIVITLNFTLVNTLLTLGIGAVIAAMEHALVREVATRRSLDTERTLLRTLIDAMPDVVFTKDLAGRFVNFNAATMSLVGVSHEHELTGRTVFDLYAEDAAARYHADDVAVMSGRPLLNREEQVVDRQNAIRWFLTIKVPLRDASGRVAGLIGISRDITERHQLEAQLRQAQKMEAVGQLAGGVAHDFNNLLTVIFGYSEVLLYQPELSAATQESVRAINDAAQRAAALTRQLLAFSRQTILQPRVLDLNAVVGETSRMLRRLIGEDVLLTTVLDPNIDRVRVDPSQLDQVLMNLAVNARDAMPQGGKLTIETRNVELSADYIASHADCSAGPHVMLAMTDSGLGMTPEVLARIFEPFYTTKGVGDGTGLGLAMVFGIIQQSGGSIQVYSEPGHGSTFKIYLPSVRESVSRSGGAAAPIVLEGRETILLVEDDEAVRSLALSSLQQLGYTVLTACDGLDAQQRLAAHDGPIDLLLTDVVMPNASGPELAESLRERYPALKVLFMSGYTDDAVVRHGLLRADVAFIQKPYAPLGLARKIREVLDA